MAHFEIITTNAGDHVALIGDNDEPVMTSEVLTGHRDAVYVVDIAASAFVPMTGQTFGITTAEPVVRRDARSPE